MNPYLLTFIIIAGAYSFGCLGRVFWSYQKPQILAARERKAARRILRKTYYLREENTLLEEALSKEATARGVSRWISPVMDLATAIHLLERSAEAYTDDQLYALLSDIYDDTKKRDDKLRRLYFSGQLPRKWAHTLVDCDYNADEFKMLVWGAMREKWLRAQGFVPDDLAT